jgi:hypothetical protein
MREKRKGKIGQFEFKGQHADIGLRGLTSCTTIVTEFVGQVLKMFDDKFFQLFPPPEELKKENLKLSCDFLSQIVLTGNNLHQESAAVIAIEKRKTHNKSKASTMSMFSKILQGKDFSRCIYKISTSLSDNKHIKDLVIVNEDTLNKDNLKEYVLNFYAKFAEQGLDQDDVIFVSGAAWHTTCFFTKVRKGEKLYYLFDSAPARSLGGSKTLGTMEVHDNLNSVIGSLKLRWSISCFNFQEGNIYAVSTLSRIFDEELYISLATKSWLSHRKLS